MAKNIKDLYEIQVKIWKEENEHFFGITPLNNWNNEKEVKDHLDNCTKKFWNNGGSCETKILLENGKCKNIDALVPESYELIFDGANGLICLYAIFEYEIHSIIDEDEIELKKEQKRAPLAYFPYPTDLCWFLGDSEYVLRISAVMNYSLITKTKNICKYQRAWTYDIEKDVFNISDAITEAEGFCNFDPFEKLTKANNDFLEDCYGEVITKNNFKNALSSIPEYDAQSILYFKYGHLSEMFKLVSKSNRFANPLMRVPIPINIVKMFSSQKSRDDRRDNGSFNNLVLSSNKLFALENSRTVIYKSQFNSSFNFSNSEKLFDAFKTSTNKSAGRSRLILDDIIIKDSILYKNVDGIYINMFALVLNDNININNNLSILSCSRFSSNNDPKRIMMTAKLRTQAVNTKGEIDPFTHETPARIIFGDFEGFNYGDSIIISKSFAKRLESSKTIKRKIKKEDFLYLKNKYSIDDFISNVDFSKIIGSFMCDNYRDIKIDSLDKDFITVTATIPFSIGDKITNLHGSKGIVSLIFEDKDMPQCINDLSDNFKAGPFDIIVSALSVYRRRAYGQIFEAWALAMEREDVNNIQDAIKLYKDDMKEFSNKSKILFNGKETINPCGINMILRLNHDAVGQQSRSYIKSNYGKMLKLGEMELLNLAARGLYDIMNELDIRSVSKHYSSFNQIKEMQKTGFIKNEPSNNLIFFNILKTIGFNFNLRQPIAYENISPEFAKLQSLLTDEQINLFEDKKY